MVAYSWSKEHNAYIKSCVTCEEVFIGAETQQASELILAKDFGVGGRSNLDGFHTSCNLCRSGKANGYSITHTEKKALYAKQGGICPLCLWPLSYAKARIDHCHTTGRIRGLLHTQCNSQLGFYETNKEQIKLYLEESNADN